MTFESLNYRKTKFELKILEILQIMDQNKTWVILKRLKIGSKSVYLSEIRLNVEEIVLFMGSLKAKSPTLET